MPRPGPPPDSETQAHFDGLLNQAIARESGNPIEYRLDAPKWQFLCHVAEHAPIVLHGSGDPNIERLQPRHAADVLGFSGRRAVYAAMDGIWAMFFAIVDRDRYPMRSRNGCIRLGIGADQLSGPYYFFSISGAALHHQPWRNGTVYLLPADDFEVQPSITVADASIQVAQAASSVSVKPIAKLTVEPDEFPFLRQIHGHDDDLLDARVDANLEGFPWLTAQ